MKSQTESIEEVQKLDFENIKTKIIKSSINGQSWNADKVALGEKWYKRFLILHLKYPSLTLVPNELVDTFWHHHILDTKKYYKDCQLVFGRLLHHRPSYGASDKDTLKQNFDNTNRYLRLEFGEDFSSMFRSVRMTNAVVCSNGACDNETDCDGQ